MVHMAEALVEDHSGPESDAFPSFEEELAQEFKGIPPELLTPHLIAMDENDSHQQWRMLGLRPGIPASIIEVSPHVLLGDQANAFRGTPVEHGITFFVQPDGKRTNIVALPATLSSFSWERLEDESDGSATPTSLTRYMAEIRKNGKFYAIPKTAKDWERFGRQEEAVNAFHQLVVTNVIRTPEMEEVFSLALQKATGKDYAAMVGVYDLTQAVVRKDAKQVGKVFMQLLELPSVEARLAAALERVQEMQNDVRDEFEYASLWSLRAPDMSGAGAGSKALRTAGTIAAGGATVLLGGSDVINTVDTNAVAAEVATVPDDVRAAIETSAPSDTMYWGAGESSRARVPASAARDMVTPVTHPTQADAAPASQAQQMAETIQKKGTDQAFADWLAGLPAESRSAIENAFAKAEAAMVGIDPSQWAEAAKGAMEEFGAALATVDMRPLIWLTEVVGVSAAAYFAVTRPKQFLQTVALLIVLAGCAPMRSGGLGAPTQEAPVATEIGGGTPTAAPPTEAPPTPTEAPTPAPFSGATEAAPTQSPYGAPAMAQAEFLPGSGGSGRNEIITRAGVPEETLVLYENAVKAWAEANGYANPLIDYLFDGKSWNMVLRDAVTGNILWSEDGNGALMTYPTIIRVDEQGIHADDAIGLRVLEGTKDSKAILVNGFVIVLRNPVSINGKQYYSEWFNTTTGEWEKLADVIAAIPIEANAVTKDELATIDWDDFTLLTADQRQIINQRVLDNPLLAKNVDTVQPVKLNTNRSAEGNQVVLGCNVGVNCAPRFAVSENTAEGTLYMLVWELIVADPDNSGKNIRVVFTAAHAPLFDTDQYQTYALDVVRGIGQQGNQVTMILVTKDKSKMSALTATLIAENEARKALEDGQFRDRNGETPVWMTQVIIF